MTVASSSGILSMAETLLSPSFVFLRVRIVEDCSATGQVLVAQYCQLWREGTGGDRTAGFVSWGRLVYSIRKARFCNDKHIQDALTTNVNTTTFETPAYWPDLNDASKHVTRLHIWRYCCYCVAAKSYFS